MNSQLRSENDLLRMYEAAALDHGRATESGDSRAANKAHDILASAYRELRQQGKQRLLLPFLNSPSVWLKLWTAAHALEFAPELGLPILEELSHRGGFLAVDARMTIKQWRKGELKFP